MNLKPTAAFAVTALAASIAFTSFVPIASAQAVPPMIGPAMHFIQTMEQQLKSLSSTIAGFAESFTTNQLTFTRGQGNEIDVQTLCIGQTCIDEAQLQAMVAAAGQASGSGQGNTAAAAIDVSPIIQINGANPAIVQVGETYQDLEQVPA